MNYTFGLLLDEHGKWALYDAIGAAAPALPLYHIDDDTAPPNGTPDPVLLQWCEAHGCALVTNNRRSMPQHLADHLAAGGHVPGIFTISGAMTIAELVDELTILAGASFPEDFADQIRYLPILR
jgi:hypothetical protein